MLGDTLTMTLDGSGGTAKVLSKINQDGYSAEYLLKEATQEFRCLVKHSKDNVKLGSQPFDRHTVTFTQYVYPTDLIPLGRTHQVALTIRNDPSAAEVDVTNLGEALTFWASDTNLTKLFGWES